MTAAAPGARPAGAKTRAQPLYEEDAWTWATEQAEALCRRDMSSIDRENVIEEIEDVGMRHRDRWVFDCARAIEHLLAIEHYDQAGAGDVRRWVSDGREFCDIMADEILDSPGLSGNYDSMFAIAWAKARRWSAPRLAGYDRERGGDQRPAETLRRIWKSRLPLECPYTRRAVTAFDHRIQDDPSLYVWPPSVARVVDEHHGSV